VGLLAVGILILKNNFHNYILSAFKNLGAINQAIHYHIE